MLIQTPASETLNPIQPVQKPRKGILTEPLYHQEYIFTTLLLMPRIRSSTLANATVRSLPFSVSVLALV